MSDLMEYLYQYAVEQAASFHGDPEGPVNRACRDRHLQWLRDNLGPEALRRLECFLDHLILAGEDRSRTLFQAGLTMGLRLGASVQAPK